MPTLLFKYQITQRLAIKASGETGECIARSEHLVSDPQYLLRYCAADGRATEAWWSEDALADAEPAVVQTPAPAATLAPDSITPPAIGQLWSAQGGIYAGIARGADGAGDHHLVLCPLNPPKLPWDEAMEWATELTALTHDGITLGNWSLPTRAESALLFANLRDQFDPTWYWTSEQYSRANAWIQTFDDGLQLNVVKSYEGRARAVRRLVIQSLSHSS